MLGVRYILGFDFVRAYQSKLKTVWCCPGALQAYRMSLIRPHLVSWLNQSFLGARCTNGDDHAMTNLVLGLGHDTMYQSNAVVKTLVPYTYFSLCKMYIRWGRSATREGLLALSYAFRRARTKSGVCGAGILIDALLQPVGIAMRIAGLIIAPYLLLSSPRFFLTGLSTAALLTIFYGIVFLASEKSVAVIHTVTYALFSALALFWIQPFATATVRNNAWLTRN